MSLSNIRLRATTRALCCVSAITSGVAHAQTADETPSDSELNEVVVTGTLLRGTAPVGANLIEVSRDAVAETGVASTNDLLATIPQISNFNTIPRGTAGFGQPIPLTNLRGLGASGGTTTLVLVDGHRLVGSAILQTYADPSIIPPGMIDRVEVLPDGGSAIYGSDAIGGVINFITRRKLNGAEVNGQYGFADNYKSTDANLTVGRDWGRSSFMLSYAYAWHDNLLGIDRDYVTQNNTPNGGTDFRATTCAPGNLTIGGVSYALPGRQPNTTNRCDTSDFVDIVPSEHRHSVYGTYNQEITDSLDFSLTGYYSLRETNARTAQLVTTGTITSANPFFRPVGTETAQSVAFGYDTVFGPNLSNPAKFDSWGFTPTLTMGLANDWQIRGMLNYGHSYSSTRERVINAAAAASALAATTPATALNPYDLTATNPSVLQAIYDNTNFSEAKQELAELRAVADGRVFTLPGGDVRLAIGAEYHYENLDPRLVNGPSTASIVVTSRSSRNVKSVYGELLVPVFGTDNGRAGLRGLDVSLSLRYDDYSDVGHTTNPKIGFTYRPLESLSFRANYGTSFHAPSLADTSNTIDSRITFLPLSPWRTASSPPSDLFRPTFFISGGTPTLKPEEADTYSIGMDFRSTFVDGLNVSLTYFNIRFRDAIGIGAIFAGSSYFADPTNAGLYILNPTIDQVRNMAGGVRLDAFASYEAAFAGAPPYVVADVKRYNRGAINTDGLDFSTSFSRRTDFGSWSASVGGTYLLDRESSSSKANVFSDNLRNGTGRLNLVAAASVRIAAVTARATYSYRDGYPILGLVNQTRVASFAPVDLYVGYDFADDLNVSLHVDNAFDRDPPYVNNNTGTGNGSTYGRMIGIGLRKSF
jgi:iron complex outermembrane receptor protein